MQPVHARAVCVCVCRSAVAPACVLTPRRLQVARDAALRPPLGRTAPCTAMVTLLHAHGDAICVRLSRHARQVLVGFESGALRVWRLDGRPHGTPVGLSAPYSMRGVPRPDLDDAAPSGAAGAAGAADEAGAGSMDGAGGGRAAGGAGGQLGEDCLLLLGHSGPVYSIALSPCERYCVSASADASLRLWSLQDGRCLVRAALLRPATPPLTAA